MIKMKFKYRRNGYVSDTENKGKTTILVKLYKDEIIDLKCNEHKIFSLPSDNFHLLYRNNKDFNM